MSTTYTHSPTHSRRPTATHLPSSLSPSIIRDNPFQTQSVGAVGSPTTATAAPTSRRQPSFSGAPGLSQAPGSGMRARKSLGSIGGGEYGFGTGGMGKLGARTAMVAAPGGGVGSGPAAGAGIGNGVASTGSVAGTGTGPAGASKVISSLEAPPAPGEHMLRHAWKIWFLYRSPGERVSDEKWGNEVKVIGGFRSIETFWSTWSHIIRPSNIPIISDYSVFKHPIRPFWEDPSNASGGRWILRLRKNLADRYFEELLLSIIGDTFSAPNQKHLKETPEAWDEGEEEENGEEDGEEEQRLGEEVCGVVLSVRKDEDILSVWTRDGREEGKRKRDRIRDAIRSVLKLPPNTQLQYKANPAATSGGHGQQASGH